MFIFGGANWELEFYMCNVYVMYVCLGCWMVQDITSIVV